MVAMKKTSLEIDFTKSKNLLTLLVGGNGTGKTTILSLLHPFAYNGNIDNRERDLIMKDKDGYKTISILYNDLVYKIEHHYKRSNDGSITLKSFIQKEDEELNPNGNVTSFKTLIYNIFNIDESYLKLIRLGSNVTNIINMSSSDRKEFMAKRLEELNTYGQLYKKVSDDVRLIKNLIKINSNNINSLNISDISLYKNNIEKMEDLLSNKEKLLEANNKSIIEIETKMNIIAPDGLEKFKIDYTNMNTEYNSLINRRDKLKTKIDKVNTKKKLTTLMDEYSKELKKYNDFSNGINELYNKRDSLKAIIESSQSSSYINNIEKRKNILEEDNRKHIDRYGKDDPKLDTNKMKEALSRLQAMENSFYGIYEYDKTLISKILKESNGKFSYYSGILKNKLSKHYNRPNIGKLRKLINDNKKYMYVMIEPNCGYPECSYRSFYKDMQEINEDNDNISNNTINIETLEKEIEICDTLLSLERYIKNNEMIFKYIPANICTVNNIFSNITKGIKLYNERDITDFILLSEEWGIYHNNKKIIKELEEELKTLKKNDKLSSYTIELSNTETSILNRERDMIKYKESLDIKEIEVNGRIKIEEDIKEYDKIIMDISILEEKINNINKDMVLLKEYYISYKDIKDLYDNLNSEVIELRDSINLMNNNLVIYYKLMAESDKLTRDLEDFSIIMNTISPKKGMPLEFINYYLDSIKYTANECLRVIYGDRLYIESMYADEKDFDIIYVKDGLIAGDVRSASQGESSFINIALSFAFLQQDVRDYNIILLDELDGVLDIDNKHRFLDILYNRLYHMNCQQCFLISHNDIYEDQDIDLILTDDSDISRYRKLNIIYSN